MEQLFGKHNETVKLKNKVYPGSQDHKQVIALIKRLVEKYTKILPIDDIVDQYLNKGLTFRQIAQNVIPKECEKDDEIGRRIISCIVNNQCNKSEELKSKKVERTRNNRISGLKLHDSDTQRERGIKGGHAQQKIKPLTSEKALQMVISRGHTPFTDKEINMIKKLKNEQLTWTQIRDKINDEFHDGKPIRNGNSIRLSYYKKTKKQPIT